jgi:cytochrome c oxidase subunit III
MNDSSEAKKRVVLDVSEFPILGFSHRTTVWWGVMLVIAIEAMTLSMLVAAYFYIRDNIPTWPIVHLSNEAVLAAAAGTFLLAASVLPNMLVDRAARREDLAGMRRWLVITTLVGIAFLVARAFEFSLLPTRWDTSAHASLIWTIIGMNTFHAGSGVLENLVVISLLFRGPVQQKHRIDVHIGAIYWSFVVLSWIPLFAILYFDR